MRALFVPDYSVGNPYQTALAAGLAKAGWDVRLGKLADVAEGPYDILHVHWPDALFLSAGPLSTLVKATLSLSAVAAAKRAGARLVWTVHNLISHERRFARAERAFTWALARMCDGLIAHSGHVKEQVVATYGVRGEIVKIIPHGSYVGLYENRLSRAAARERLGYQSSDIVLATIGAIRSYKGIPELVAAFRESADPRARLLIAGRPLDSGTERNVQDLCRADDRIKTVFGYIPNDQLQIYMNAADAVVLPYRDITTSGAAILAMSFGKTIIAPALPFMKETLAPAGAIFYGVGSEARDLAEALAQAVARGSALHELGQHNLEAAGRTSWEEIGRETARLYERTRRR